MEPLNPETLNGITALANSNISLFGQSLPREIVIIGVSAALFFLGVVVGCVLKLNGSARALDVVLASILVFFLSTPVSARIMNGDWGGTTIGAVDQTLDWIKNAGPVPNTFFAFGVVMVFGLMSWPLFQLVIRVLRRALSFLDKKAKPA
jgi:hypothetical protein